ncbi:hypothetical protein BTS2_3561 [Bacillus sp. TS-2]|nr:hypothetical protein BTS2_3561 [Bacillus sp. TS-2]
MSFELHTPLYLLLFVPAVFVVILFIKSTIYSKKSKQRSVILILRSFVFSLLILALTDPSLVLTSKVVETVFVFDRSESMSLEQVEIEQNLVKAIEKKKGEDSFAIVSVGEHAIVDRLMGTHSQYSLQSELNSNQTNLEEGLQLAASLFSQSTGRVVLISDGLETKGDSKVQTEIVNQQGITVDTFFVDRQLKQDVAISELNVTKQAYAGEEIIISTEINSTENMQAAIRIRANQELIVDQQIDLKRGVNTYPFSFVTQESGQLIIDVEIEGDYDEIPENNHLTALSQVVGEPKVLVVEGEDGAASNLTKALEASGTSYDLLSAEQLPTRLNRFLNYQSIVFADVSATNISQAQMDLIETAVKQFGVGFIMTGGESSFGLGGYFKTPIEELLPVEMEIKSEEELPSLGIIFVIDRSGSMQGNRIQLAKEAAARSVELLRNEDVVGVIAFDEQPWQIVETGPLGNPDEVVEQISSITADGGTDIFQALDMAYPQLAEQELQRKHIILLSDGDSAFQSQYQALVESGLEEEGITLSTVAIGQDANHALLSQIAEMGSGNFYSVYDESTIPSIVSRETILMTKTYIVDEPFYPTVVRQSEWNSYFESGYPSLNAYIATTNKNTAELILQSDNEDPILTRWQYGLGKTVAWTSDLKGEWSGDWVNWQNWSLLWNEMISWTLQNINDEPFFVTQNQKGSETVVEFISEEASTEFLQAEVVDSFGESIKSQYKMVEPGKYEVSFEGEPGIHFIQLTNPLNDELVYQSSVSVPYSAEFSLEEANEAMMTEIAQAGSGEVLEELSQAFRPLMTPLQEKKSIAIPLILVAFLLLFLEITIRRLGLISLSFFKRQKQKEVVSKNSVVFEKVKKSIRKNEKLSKRESKKMNQANGSIETDGLKKEAKEKMSKLSSSSSKGKKEKSNKSLKNSEQGVSRQEDVNPSSQSGNDERMKRLLEAKKRNRGRYER